MLPAPKSLLAGGLAVLALLPWIGCRRPTTAAATAAREGRLLAGNGVEPSTLDPHLNTGAPEAVIISALWEPLVQWNAAATDVVPAAAENWHVSADGLVYTFCLRHDARWSNGDAVTADHWARSIRRLLEPALASPLAGKAFDLAGAEAYYRGREKDPAAIGVSAADAHTLVLRLQAPSVGFLGTLTLQPWVPVHAGTVAAAGFTQPGKLITNGVFRLAEWRVGQFVRVEPNPYFRRAPALREVRFFAIESVDAEERTYRSGQLHLTAGLPPWKVASYRQAADPALRVTPRVGTSYLVFNVEKPPFTDARVRRALALAIERRQLVEAVLRAGEQPARALVYPVPGGYQPHPVLSESLAEARRLLAEAGYPEGRGFPPTDYLYNTNEKNREVAEAIQEMWRRNLGLAIGLRNEEWKVFLQTRRQGSFQIARGGWLAVTPEPIEMYEVLLSTSAYNNTNWKHAAFDQLYWSARRTMEPGPRHALYGRMDAILRDEMPVVPLAYYTTARLVHPMVRNWPDSIVDARPWELVAVGQTP